MADTSEVTTRSVTLGIDTAKAVDNVMEGSIIVELVTKRYGIRKVADMGAVEFRKDPRAAAMDEDEESETVELMPVARVDKKMFTIRKKLFDSPEWQDIKNFDQETFRWVQRYSVKTNLRPGSYRVPASLFEQVDSYLSQRQKERIELVGIFVEALPILQERAARSLGVAYQEADYDTAAKVRAGFDFTYRVLVEEVPGKLKSLSREAYDREVGKAKAQVVREVEVMVREMRNGFASIVAHATERLQPDAEGKLKVFKASTLENISAFLDLFEHRNLAGDKELGELVKQARSLMRGVNATDLRKDLDARQKMADGFEKITESMGALIGDAPTRKIKLRS